LSAQQRPKECFEAGLIAGDQASPGIPVPTGAGLDQSRFR
jgi:hypothetical protein